MLLDINTTTSRQATHTRTHTEIAQLRHKHNQPLTTIANPSTTSIVATRSFAVTLHPSRSTRLFQDCLRGRVKIRGPSRVGPGRVYSVRPDPSNRKHFLTRPAGRVLPRVKGATCIFALRVRTHPAAAAATTAPIKSAKEKANYKNTKKKRRQHQQRRLLQYIETLHNKPFDILPPGATSLVRTYAAQHGSPNCVVS